MVVDERALLEASSHGLLPLPATDDEGARALALVARLEALGLLTPGADGRATAGRTTLAAPVGVVDGVHRTAALVRLAAEPAVAAGLAEDDVLVLRVADGAHRRVALAVEPAQFTGRHAHGHVGPVA